MTDSADSWVGNAPRAWTRGRLKDLIASATNGTWGNEPEGNANDVSCIRAADFDRLKRRARVDDAPLRNVDPVTLRKHALQVGDLVLEKSGGGEKQPVGMAVLYDSSTIAVCSNFCARVTPAPGIDPRYLCYALSAAYAQGLTEISIKQTTGIQNLDTNAFFASSWAYPNTEEQRRIADFLDAETARIDRLHNLRKRQQNLLEERGFRRVYDAVRGTAVEGPRKDSGLDWLGTVPVTWRIAAVSHYFEVELGKMLNQERAEGQHLRPYLRVANVQWDAIDTSQLARMDFPPQEQSRYRLKPGDLLVNEGGSWPGRAAIWNGDIAEIYYQKALHRIRTRRAESPRWLYYCLLVAERLEVFRVQGNTSTITHLTREQLRPQRFPFPDVSVQHDLVEKLDRALARDKKVQDILDRQMMLLAERRQALITAAVTGQFDVSSASGRDLTSGVSA